MLELNHKLRTGYRQFVLAKLRSHDLMDALRGSWKYNDFHLDHIGKQSFSDLDLMVDVSATDQQKIKSSLERDLAPCLTLPVSVHGADSLLKINLEDSFVLNIGEFIAKTRLKGECDSFYHYTLAKISLLLLRTSSRERYEAVAHRIDAPEAHAALAVKLGRESTFDVNAAKLLLTHSSHPTAREFYERCILETPGEAFLTSFRSRIRSCKTIEPWLQEYLIKKIDGQA
jgi:hypothetical protein